MNDILATLAVVILAVGAAIAFAALGSARIAARAVLREKLERGDIRPEEYAAHLRALDEAA